MLMINDAHSPCLSPTNPFRISFLDALADGLAGSSGCNRLQDSCVAVDYGRRQR